MTGATPAAVLAVDGGNSKTDAALVGSDGALLAYARGSGSCHQVIGVSASMSVLAGLVARLATQAGLDPTRPLARHGAFYLAGADFPAEVTMLREHVAAAGWVDDAVVDNDTFALLRTGTELPDRVAVVCGAGINCVGVSEAGGVVRFPSLGRLSGDWGGGAHLGGEALWLAIRDEDGRGRPTALRDAVAAHFGCKTVLEVIAAIHLGGLSADRIHELVPVLFRVAAEGDALAREVVTRMAEEVALMATVALRKLELLDRPADVVLGGGVLASRDPLLLDTVEELLRVAAPRARTCVVDEPPVVGAALLGLDALDTAPVAEERLRLALLERSTAARAGR